MKVFVGENVARGNNCRFNHFAVGSWGREPPKAHSASSKGQR